MSPHGFGLIGDEEHNPGIWGVWSALKKQGVDLEFWLRRTPEAPSQEPARSPRNNQDGRETTDVWPKELSDPDLLRARLQRVSPRLDPETQRLATIVLDESVKSAGFITELRETRRDIQGELASLALEQLGLKFSMVALEKGASLWEDLVCLLDGQLTATVIRVADVVAQSDAGLAANILRFCLDNAYDPQEQLEVAYLIAERARVRPEPLKRGPLLEPTAEGSLLFEGLHWYDILEYRTTQGPQYPNSQELTRLTLEGYGRVYGVLFSSLASEDPHPADIELSLGAIVLDGLNVLLLQLGLNEHCSTVYEAFKEWPERLEDETLIQSGFEKTQAWIERQFCGQSDRKRGERRLARELGETWVQLPRLTRIFLVTGECHLENLDRGADFDSAANGYAKAVEHMLRGTLGTYLDEKPDQPLARMFRAEINGSRRNEVKRFSTLSLSSFGDACKRLEPKLSNDFVRSLCQGLKKLVPLRTKAAHAPRDDIWKVSREEAERARESSIALIRLLAGAQLGTR